MAFRFLSVDWTFNMQIINFFICRSFQPVVLSYLIGLFSESGDKSTEMYIAGSVLIGTSIVVIFVTHHGTFGLSIVGMRLRISTSSLIYRKVSLICRQQMMRMRIGNFTKDHQLPYFLNMCRGLLRVGTGLLGVQFYRFKSKPRH